MKNSDAMAITVRCRVRDAVPDSLVKSFKPLWLCLIFAEQPSDTPKYVPPNDFKKNHAADLPFSTVKSQGSHFTEVVPKAGLLQVNAGALRVDISRNMSSESSFAALFPWFANN